MNEQEVEVLKAVRVRVEELFEGEGTGHDWWHIVRVVNNAVTIAKKENSNLYMVELAALVHDIGDHKFCTEEDAQEKLITQLLNEVGCDKISIDEVLQIVKTVSYKGADVETKPKSLEGRIVQDADRLDAIGAIGIARAFAYGGNKNRLLYHPEEKPTMHSDFESYKNDNGHTINHFYEKLLLLKDRMQTDTGRLMAQQRHDYMQAFLEQFYSEWEGESK